MTTPDDRHDEGSTVSSGGCCGPTPEPEDPRAAHEDRHDGRAAVSSGGCCGPTPEPEDPRAAHTDAVTECPVMVSIPVIKASAEDAGLYRDYHGQRYWLCCASCAQRFDADPERYVAA